MKIKKALPVIIGFIGLSLIWATLSGFKGMDRAPSLSAVAARHLIAQHANDDGFVVLDIRTPGEYAQGHIAGARLLDYYGPGFKKAFSRLDRDKTYLLYCRSGNRSGRTLALAAELGFPRIYHMSKGISEWQVKGFPLVKSVSQ